MIQYILKDAIVDKIKTDPDLFAQVAKAVDVSVFTLPDLLRKASPKLTQKSCLVALSKHLKVKEHDLLEVSEPIAA